MVRMSVSMFIPMVAFFVQLSIRGIPFVRFRSKAMGFSLSLKFKVNSDVEDNIDRSKEILEIQPANINDLHQIAIFVAREKMQVVQFASDITCMMSPAFSMVYIQELERLETNFQSLPCDSMQRAMLIAKYMQQNGSSVVAYVDMDRRREVVDSRLPVPYISDLIVSPHHRKKVDVYLLSSDSILNKCSN